MTVGNLPQLRAMLTQLSAMSSMDQLAYVLNANASLDGLRRDPALEESHRAIANTLSSNGHGASLPSPDLRWLRWQNEKKEKGVALTFVNATNRHILFPSDTDPTMLRLLSSDERFDDSDPAPLKLIPDKSIRARMMLEYGSDPSRWPVLAYVHRSRLYVPARPDDDLVRYARFLRLVEQRRQPPLPAFRSVLSGSSAYAIDERRAGPHTGMFALQKDLEYLLGTLHPHNAAYGWMSLESACSVYPSPTEILSQAPDLGGILPAEACFGAGDPLATELTIEINDRRILTTANGKEAGWARMVTGGEEGRHSDGVSGLSAATSKGGRDYQQDGFYLAHFRSNDREGGRDVRVFVGVDGLGGNEMSELAASAALQGAHACIVKALRERRLPLAEDLFDAAREALEYHTLREEMADGTGFPQHRAPDTVIAVWVVVDGVATIATAGDFLVLLCERNAQGRLEVTGRTAVDSGSEHSVHNTLRGGVKRLYRKRLPPGSFLVGASDGTMGGLARNFKQRAASRYRQERFDAYPDQSLFFNLLHILEHAPSHLAGPALHDAGAGIELIPGGTGSYPGLDLIEPESDNWTGAALFWKGGAEGEPLNLSQKYGDLESVSPAYQYIHEDGPYRLNFPAPKKELFVGRKTDREGRPTVVIADRRLGSPHVRLIRIIEKQGDDEVERLYVEKLVAAGRVALLDERDNPIVTLRLKGSRHEIKPGHLIRLNPRTFFRLED